MTASHSVTLLQTAVDRHLSGDLEGAIPVYDALIREDPRQFRALYNRGLALEGVGRAAEALVSYALALAAKPDYADAYINLAGVTERVAGRDAAIEVLASGRGACPDNPVILHNLANLHAAAGDHDRALHLYQAAADHSPEWPVPLLGLGKCAFELGRLQDARSAYETALGLSDRNADAMNGLGAVLRALGHTDEALAWFRKASECSPDNADAYNNLGLVLRQKGCFKEALESFKRSLRIRPESITAHDNYLFCLQYDPGVTPASMLAEARTWRRHVAAVQPLPASPPVPGAGGRLRIGFVSPDFREHACSYYLEPLLACHDRSRLEVHAYAEVAIPDAVTERMRASCDGWVTTIGLSDRQLAERIRADGIHILIDCAGHTGGNRLGVFAYRPAPLQVATLVGYCATTGLDCFDWILGDPYITPADSEVEFTEPLYRLPDAIAPFLPRASWPEPAPVPPEQPVIGCVSDPARIDGVTVDLWRRVLDRVPGAILLLKHPLFNDRATAMEWRTRLSRLEGRVFLEGTPGGWGANMEAYGRFSVVFDTPMHSGGTTVAIPVWMGVPVITLSGTNVWQRTASSLLSNVGLADLVARSGEEFVAIASSLLADRTRQQTFRSGLRSAMAASPLCDYSRFGETLFTAYQDMWRRYLAQAGAAS